MFQNCFLWQIGGNSLVIILLFISINNLQIAMIKNSMWLFSFIHKEQKAMKVFVYCLSKKNEIWKFGGEGRENYCNDQYFHNQLVMQSSLTLSICWRHIRREISAALHLAPVSSQVSRRRHMGQASWLSILKLAPVQAGSGRTLC